MKRAALVTIALVIFIYFVGYVWIRQTRIEIWEKDANSYVIFPDDKVYLYYFYRPLSWIDGSITGMKFHIGPHR